MDPYGPKNGPLEANFKGPWGQRAFQGLFMIQMDQLSLDKRQTVWFEVNLTFGFRDTIFFR